MTQPEDTGRFLAVTQGDPAGIGLELIGRAWLSGRSPPFAVLTSPALLASRLARFGLAAPVEAVDVGDVASAFQRAIPVIDSGMAVEDRPGAPDEATARSTIASIDDAVGLAKAGVASAVVTLPIAKHVLYAAGFRHPGHTEHLGDLAGRHWTGGPFTPVMLLWSEPLAVALVTVHVSLAEAAATLSTEAIVATGRIVDRDMRRRFGVAAARLAVCGLNPHAGEYGAMGDEDIRIVAPAVAALRALGIDATGPYPADTLFHPEARRRYDVALAMYHDQGLIPIKTIAFHDAVNVTLGLPFVRTSPDHGTGFDIAAKGVARPDSLLAALALAARLSTS